MPRVYVAADLIDAHLLVDALRGQGIVARVLNAHAAGALGELSFADAWPEVWIAEAHDLARAAPVVASHARRSSADGPDRRCEGCGGTGPARFAPCWQCGGWIDPSEAP